MLVFLIANAKILAVKAGTSIHLACLPCQPACLVSLPALSASLPCQPACLVSQPALSASLPCQPACLVSHLPCFCLLPAPSNLNSPKIVFYKYFI